MAQNECNATLEEVGFAMNHSDHFRVTRTYVKIDFSPAWKLNEKVIEKIFFTEDKSNSLLLKEEENVTFERFSFKQLIKGTIYYRGRVMGTVEDIGFNNVEEVIDKLMSQLPKTLPARTMVQIRLENKDKGQKQDCSRMIQYPK